MIYWIAGYAVGVIVTYAVAAAWIMKHHEAPGQAIIYAVFWPLTLCVIAYSLIYDVLEGLANVMGIPMKALDRFVWFALGAGSSGVIALLVD